VTGAPGDRSRDDVAEVIRAIGPRRSAPAELADRVHSRVRAHWESDVRSRRAWRLRSVALAMAAAIMIGIAASIATTRTSDTAPIAGTAATVDLVLDSAWSQGSPTSVVAALHRGDLVPFGAEVATEGRGRIAMTLASGHSLRLDAGTRVAVISDRIIALERGAVYLDSRTIAGRAAGSIEIRTPLGIVRDVGTQFEVRALDGALSVRVREGQVAVTVAGGKVVTVDAGRQIRLTANGDAVSEATASGDLNWLNGVTPMIDVDGRSLYAFLEWAARERGLSLAFASAELAAVSRTIVLSGSVHGMTIDEALEALLATSQMSPAVDHGVLQVRAVSGSRGDR
jgi:ferric-dicitrate binding protein FerR (iron transport regulator)